MFRLHRVPQACAWLLILLAALPFTAPFSVCDAGMLFADSHSAAAQLLHPVATAADLDSLREDASPGPMLDEETFTVATVPTVTMFVAVAVTTLVTTPQDRATSVDRTPLVPLRV